MFPLARRKQTLRRRTRRQKAASSWSIDLHPSKEVAFRTFREAHHDPSYLALLSLLSIAFLCLTRTLSDDRSLLVRTMAKYFCIVPQLTDRMDLVIMRDIKERRLH